VPRLAIVIPATGTIASMESTLLSVLENRPEQCEVLVVLNQPYDDPYLLADEVRFVQAEVRSDLVACANLGVSRSSSPIVHVLGCGCEATSGWTAEPQRRFIDPLVAAVAPLLIVPGVHGAMQTCGVAYSARGCSRAIVVKPDAQTAPKAPLAAPLVGGFFRKAALDVVGGFSAAVGSALSEIDTAFMLRAAGYRTVAEIHSVVKLPPSESPQGAFGSAFYAERLFWRSAPSVGWSKSLVCHPLSIAYELVRSFPRWRMVTQVTARLLALAYVLHYRRHYRRLRQIEIEAAAKSTIKAAACIRIDRSHGKRRVREESPRARAG